jgi:hypothetical protein
MELQPFAISLYFKGHDLGPDHRHWMFQYSQSSGGHYTFPPTSESPFAGSFFAPLVDLYQWTEVVDRSAWQTMTADTVAIGLQRV